MSIDNMVQGRSWIGTAARLNRMPSDEPFGVLSTSTIGNLKHILLAVRDAAWVPNRDAHEGWGLTVQDISWARANAVSILPELDTALRIATLDVLVSRPGQPACETEGCSIGDCATCKYIAGLEAEIAKQRQANVQLQQILRDKVTALGLFQAAYQQREGAPEVEHEDNEKESERSAA